MRIVVIDDDEDFLQLIKIPLEEKGCEVFTFTNPKICPLQMIPVCRCEENEKCTDLIITDIQMPEMNGFEFLEFHRAKNCHCKDVVIMSGIMNDDDIEKAHSLGCKTFPKSLPFNQLLEYVEDVEHKIPSQRRLRDWFLEVTRNSNSYRKST